MALASINPATGETLERFAPHDDAAVEQRVARAHVQFATGRSLAPRERAAWLARAAEVLEAERDALAREMVHEMGKPRRAAVDEVLKCARVCRYYAEHGPAMLADERVATEAAQSFVRYQPLGPVLAVMPWNFPFWQVFRFAAPALVAGNVGLLKHASNVPRCALAIERVWRTAGAPPGAFQTLLVGSDRVGALIADRRIAAVTITGSEAAGIEVAAAAGRNLKKSVLELGGSDPFVVMPSADVRAAADAAVRARTINNGQSCIAAKRFIVHHAIAAEFEQHFVAGMAALRVGDPMDDATEIGPLATRAIRDELAAQVEATVRAGARVLTGGVVLDRPGFFYAPTVLTDIPEGSPAQRDELFGPVAAVFRARDLSHAIALANDTSFGLGASVWTRDEGERARLVDEIDSGQVFVNSMVVSDPRLPFGGVKRSGYGRELGLLGLREFLNAKTVVVHQAPAAETSRAE